MLAIKTAIANTALRRLLVAQLPTDFADWLDFAAIGVLLSFHWDAEALVFCVSGSCNGTAIHPCRAFGRGHDRPIADPGGSDRQQSGARGRNRGAGFRGQLAGFAAVCLAAQRGRRVFHPGPTGGVAGAGAARSTDGGEWDQPRDQSGIKDTRPGAGRRVDGLLGPA